ncbi:MAG: sigma-E factor regulatory protein RseB domain-containing protein [Bryobacteraceae bacterium]|nr:sigma-E factor regulatory protein RseB domain-containing protein [Bryobacteraceae bacterium]
MLHTLLLAALASSATTDVKADDILARMLNADRERSAAMKGYTGFRRYTFENKRVGKRAEVTVRVVCDSSGAKRFEVVSESGSGFVRKRIIGKMIDAEVEASRQGEREQTKIIPANYDFRLVGQEVLAGRNTFVFEISPKAEHKFLIRGRIWVDAQDMVICRVEGQPAKNPSFWIKKVRVVQEYARAGAVWLPLANQSHAEARIFGATDVSIVYFDYVVAPPEAGDGSKP